MAQFAVINRSLNSQDSNRNRNPPNAAMSFNNSYSKEGMPENGGMLKPSMRFEYEFSSPKKKQEGSPFRSEAPREVGMFKLKAGDAGMKEGKTLNANLFSCMDGTQYEREFEVSPGLIDKQ
jgi:hypothetical protein